jgi:hypothetical protein
MILRHQGLETTRVYLGKVRETGNDTLDGYP